MALLNLRFEPMQFSEQKVENIFVDTSEDSAEPRNKKNRKFIQNLNFKSQAETKSSTALLQLNDVFRCTTMHK